MGFPVTAKGCSLQLDFQKSIQHGIDTARPRRAQWRNIFRASRSLSLQLFLQPADLSVVYLWAISPPDKLSRCAVVRAANNHVPATPDTFLPRPRWKFQPFDYRLTLTCPVSRGWDIRGTEQKKRAAVDPLVAESGMETGS